MLERPTSLSHNFLPATRLRSLCKALLVSAVCGLFATFLFAAPADVATAPNGTHTDPLNLTPEVQAAYRDFYDLNFAEAEKRFEKIAADHPADPMAAGYVLNNSVFRELYRLDLLDTTLYVEDGFLSGKHPVVEDMKVRARIDGLYRHAVELSNQRLRANPQDINALFARGFAVSLETMYSGMIEKRYVPALHLAMLARNDNDQVLRRDPKYVDCYLVVGVHDYVLGSLALPLKILAGLVGIHGSKSQGIAELQRVGQYGTINSVSARTALSIFLRRDAKYGEAIQVIDGLHQQYPRNFLFSLEQANLLKDAGKGMAAIAAYQDLLTVASKPGGYYADPHLEMAYYGLGEAARGQRQIAVAAAAYKDAADQPTASPLMQRRAHLAAGQMYDLLAQHPQAKQQYEAVVDLGADSGQAARAKKFEQSPYAGQ
ncbi:MAG: tetratricopeptide repeat protein [Acidobacteriaceae bacterium]